MCQIFFIVVILFLKELQPIRNVGTFSFSSRVRADRGAAPALLVRQAAARAAAERAAARGTRAGR